MELVLVFGITVCARLNSAGDKDGMQTNQDNGGLTLIGSLT